VSHSIGGPRQLYGTDADAASQRAAFRNGDVPVAVYGLGKMGLPLASVYADVTGNTAGVDVDPAVVESVNDGDCHVAREPGLDELVADVVGRDALHAVSDGVAAAKMASVHVLMVPTLLYDDGDPDVSAIVSVVQDIAQGLEAGDLVVIESTVPPRTCQDLVVPVLAQESGLDPDRFGVACCPERTVSGQALADIRGTHPKIVGGVDEESTRVASLVYGEITDNEVIEVSDATTAAAVKVFEGVYRDVNIGLANQLGMYAEEMAIDVREAIETANTQPFCDIHDPGPGVGGHCIPVYPHFLTGQFEREAPLIESAREVNNGMPEYTVELLRAMLEVEDVAVAEARVLLLGVTYKANIAELRNTPARAIAQQLQTAGTDVLAVDPLVTEWEAFDGVTPLSLAEATAEDVDAVLLLTGHDEFDQLEWTAFDAPILDGHDDIDGESTDADVVTIGGRWPQS
jgi:UDP-N-acetyl-D-mannosaminuronic acid dehydrogenase